MGEVMRFKPHVYFGVDIIKEKKDNGIQQKVVIVLRRKGSQYVLLSPISLLLNPFSTLATATRKEYAGRLVSFLNYYYSQNNQGLFKEIGPDSLASYLDFLTRTGHTRAYVESTMRMLIKEFYYATRNYPGVSDFLTTDFVVSGKSKRFVVGCPKVEVGFIPPSTKTDLYKKRNKIKNLEVGIVIWFLLIAVKESPNCALGFYYLFFGGLRASEVLHLTSDDVPRVVSNSNFYVTLYDKVLNQDSKYSDVNQNKRQRKQEVFMIEELYNPLFEIWKRKYKTGPIVRNRERKSMTLQNFYYHFKKIKTILINELSNGTEAEKRKAIELGISDWGTHIGRAFFSNLVNENTKNPYLVSVKRGDSSFESVLPYLSNSDKMNKRITEELNNTFYQLKEKYEDYIKSQRN